MKFCLAFAALHHCDGEAAVLTVDALAARKILGLAHHETLERPEGIEVFRLIYRLEDEPEDEQEIEVVTRHEAQDSQHTQLGGGIPSEGHLGSQEADDAQHEESNYHLSNEHNARQIDCFSEMGVQDDE